jgi:hypothetical protein
MRSLYKIALKFVFWFQWRFDIYSKWSRLHQKLREQKYIKNHPLRPGRIDNFEDLTAALGTVEYKPDSWKSLFDHIASPEKVQYILDTGKQVKSGLDCDDFSIYASAIIKWWRENSQKNTFGGVPVNSPYMMSVIWLDGWKQVGHNMCVFSYFDSDGYLHYACISNWDDCEVRWGFNSLDDIVRYAVGLGEFVSAQLLTVESDDGPGYRVYTKSYMHKSEMLSGWTRR